MSEKATTAARAPARVRAALLAGGLAAAVAITTAITAATAAWGQVHGDAARVNGVPITNQRLERAFDELLREKRIAIAAIRNPAQAKRLKREALDALIDQELLWQRAQLGGIVVAREEVDAAIASIAAGFSTPAAFEGRLRAEGYTAATYAEHMRRLLAARKVLEQAVAAVPPATEEAIAAHYAANAARYVRPEQRRLRHLFLPLPAPSTAEQREQALARVRQWAQAVREGADFAALAREHSQGPSAERGGDLGYVLREELTPDLAQAAFALREGEVSAPLATPDGVHLFRCEEHLPSRQEPLSTQREAIATLLRRQAADAALAAFRSRLLQEARVEVLAPLPPLSAVQDEPYSPSQRARLGAASGAASGAR